MIRIIFEASEASGGGGGGRVIFTREIEADPLDT
jgi:hypothetical protein